MSNTKGPNASFVSHTPAWEDKCMQLFPAEVANYLRFEAASDYNTKQVAELMVKYRDAAEVLKILKLNDCANTLEIYGPDHPSLQ